MRIVYLLDYCIDLLKRSAFRYHKVILLLLQIDLSTFPVWNGSGVTSSSYYFINS